VAQQERELTKREKERNAVSKTGTRADVEELG
jgi:hypothetical protein